MKTHKHKWFPTGEIYNAKGGMVGAIMALRRSGFQNQNLDSLKEADELEKKLYELKDINERKWVCECGKVKWVKEKE